MKTHLYRFYCSKGGLLYVGISCRFIQRLMDHKASKTWFDEVRDIHLEVYETREEAEAREVDAIKNEEPLYNIMHKKITSGGMSTEVALEIAAVMDGKYYFDTDRAAWCEEKGGLAEIAIDKLIKDKLREIRGGFSSPYFLKVKSKIRGLLSGTREPKEQFAWCDDLIKHMQDEPIHE